MRGRLRTVVVGIVAMGALTVGACGDDGDGGSDDGTEVDDEDGGSEENGGDGGASGDEATMDVLGQQFEDMGIDDDQASCLVDAQAELDREPGEPIDESTRQEILDRCGVEAGDAGE